MFMRLGLLTVITWIMKLKNDLFTILDNGISGKDLILIAGGLFLVYKSSTEIYHKTEGEEGDESKEFNRLSFNAVIVQIMIMDLVFSLDSIITAVDWLNICGWCVRLLLFQLGLWCGLQLRWLILLTDILLLKFLPWAFLLLIGFALVAEGFDIHIPKGYIYFSMGFAFLVNLIQMRTSKKTKTKPVELHEHYTEAEEDLPKDVF